MYCQDFSDTLRPHGTKQEISMNQLTVLCLWEMRVFKNRQSKFGDCKSQFNTLDHHFGIHFGRKWIATLTNLSNSFRSL